METDTQSSEDEEITIRELDKCIEPCGDNTIHAWVVVRSNGDFVGDFMVVYTEDRRPLSDSSNPYWNEGYDGVGSIGGEFVDKQPSTNMMMEVADIVSDEIGENVNQAFKQ